MSIKYPIYMTILLRDYPSISSGRKNMKEHHKRILKTKKLIKKFYLKNISKEKT